MLPRRALLALAASPVPLARAAAPDGLDVRAGVLVFRLTPPGGRGTPSLLFPSSHAPDPRLLRLSTESLLGGARRVLIETDAGPEGIPREWLTLPPGEFLDLPALLGPAGLRRLRTQLLCLDGAHPPVRDPLPGAARMRAFQLASLAMQPCPAPPQRQPASPEAWLMGSAQALGIPVSALETVEEAFGALLALPDALWLAGLQAAILDPARQAAIEQASQRAYEAGDLDVLRQLTAAAVTPSPEGQAMFDAEVIVARNARIAPRLAERARAGKVVAVLGAAHLPGPDGVAERLRSDGFGVETVRFRGVG
ncbi:TraB/GumN family protein [Roseomonas sp. OT10]|uniref:TraB/GumN family protein n=1 Tax=Roseomonas cutis TaxID=2897332 RepID=UPI001E50ED93|nr:TraB/GumN family protein [Roseomonas sp. OT10]UFN49381.1 TraB/GumN family protein [Roseomonas sp. OT10]